MSDMAVSFEAPTLDLSSGASTEDNDLDLGSEGQGEGQGEGEGGEAEGGEGEGEQQQQPSQFRAVENGRISPPIKALLDKVKAEDPKDGPKISKAIQRALFAEDRLRSELPGGFKDLAALREQLDQLGGDAGIEEMRGELNGWREFDQQFAAGDPKVLEFLTETPEAKDAFMRIAPGAFEKYRELNPDAYSAYVSQVFSADMQQEEIPMALQLLANVLSRAQFAAEPDKQQASDLVKKLIGYVNRIGDFARKEVKLPERAADTRSSELDNREQNLRKQEWEGETARQHGNLFGTAWQRLVAPALPTDKAKAQAVTALIRRIYPLHLQEQLAKKKDFDANMGRYFKANQKDGFMRLHASAFKEAVPLALRAAMNEAGITRRVAPAQNGANGARPAAQGGTPAKVAEGFAHVARKPDIHTEVNRMLTTPTMLLKKQAILKNGKKVTWD